VIKPNLAFFVGDREQVRPNIIQSVQSDVDAEQIVGVSSSLNRVDYALGGFSGGNQDRNADVRSDMDYGVSGTGRIAGQELLRPVARVIAGDDRVCARSMRNLERAVLLNNETSFWLYAHALYDAVVHGSQCPFDLRQYR
jgi:hypothetical protein